MTLVPLFLESFSLVLVGTDLADYQAHCLGLCSFKNQSWSRLGLCWCLSQSHLGQSQTQARSCLGLRQF